MERRGDPSDGRSPMALLEQMPALVVLERFPMPVLAIADDGAILFANTAFADLLGYPIDEVTSLGFAEIFRQLPTDESPVSVVRAYADVIVELVHRDRSVVRAKMSKSALRRGDDPVALATFQDFTEQLWVEEL